MNDIHWIWSKFILKLRTSVKQKRIENAERKVNRLESYVWIHVWCVLHFTWANEMLATIVAIQCQLWIKMGKESIWFDLVLFFFSFGVLFTLLSFIRHSIFNWIFISIRIWLACTFYDIRRPSVRQPNWKWMKVFQIVQKNAWNLFNA